MRRRRSETESPWASFSDALSGMLFVFVITTFWFALQLAEARARTQQRQSEFERALQRQRDKKDLEARLVSEDDPQSLTSCLGEQEGNTPSVIQAEADTAEARVSLYLTAVSLENVAWFDSYQDTFQDPETTDKALNRVARCIDQLLHRPDLENYRLRVYVEGHTDGVPVTAGEAGADGKTNWELSGARAARVLRRVREAEIPSTSATSVPRIREEQDRGRLELIAVGWADLKPAISRLCQYPSDAIDQEVCAALLAHDSAMDVFQRYPQIFDRSATHKCRELAFGPLETHSESELVRLWANRCLEASADGKLTRRRLEMLRRVDLRIELLDMATP